MEEKNETLIVRLEPLQFGEVVPISVRYFWPLYAGLALILTALLYNLIQILFISIIISIFIAILFLVKSTSTIIKSSTKNGQVVYKFVKGIITIQNDVMSWSFKMSHGVTCVEISPLLLVFSFVDSQKRILKVTDRETADKVIAYCSN